MSRFLRQSTVSTIKLGPFLNPTDGLTPYSTVGFTVKLGVNGVALAARNDSTTITYDADGYFAVELNATDTAALGRLKVEVAGSAGNYLPVWDEFTVLSGAVYDSLFGTVALSTFAASQLLGAERDVTSVADNAMTFNDAFWGAVVSAGGKAGPLSGTSYPVKTPAGTLYRTFTVDTATATNNPGASRT